MALIRNEVVTRPETLGEYFFIPVRSFPYMIWAISVRSRVLTTKSCSPLPRIRCCFRPVPCSIFRLGLRCLEGRLLPGENRSFWNPKKYLILVLFVKFFSEIWLESEKGTRWHLSISKSWWYTTTGSYKKFYEHNAQNHHDIIHLSTIYKVVLLK